MSGFSFFITIFLCSIADTNASGIIELLISSPQSVLIKSTACASFKCPVHDELSVPRNVEGGVPLRIHIGQYRGEARQNIDLHFEILEPSTNEMLALEQHRAPSDTKWNTGLPIVIETTLGFNVTVHLRNVCTSNYYGKRCNRYCIPSPALHWECSTNGVRQCAVGWYGNDCSSGVNQIESRNIPLLDIKFCSHQNPCANGGVCSTDYICQCPSEFLGPRCETPVSKVHCTLERVCKHGGTCVSVNRTNVQCKCIRGFLGSLCEIGIHGNCSAMRCSVDETCQIRASFAPYHYDNLYFSVCVAGLALVASKWKKSEAGPILPTVVYTASPNTRSTVYKVLSCHNLDNPKK
uniref:Delta-like protein n=1 Tax=Caenorhabditis elegans TaxID=6239 RepID=Q17377_CAEEL|nr:ARG-1 [Caenorhabditis elegans]